MIKNFILRHKSLVEIIVLLIVSALIYLPYLHHVGYILDDWYLMYAAHVKGPLAFVDLFKSDRPMRAFVMIAAHVLFGEKVLFYNLSAYFLRFLATLGFLWAIRMLWRSQRAATFTAALLFIIYPGFLSQLNGIDYQSQMVSLAAAMFSIAFSFRAATSQRTVHKIAWLVPAFLSGWFYLGLVEYFIGLEAFRFGGLFFLVKRRAGNKKEIMRLFVKEIAPYVLYLGGYLVWRVFIFQSERGATDIGQQLLSFYMAPLKTTVDWFFLLLKDMWNVAFLAWGAPLVRAYAQMNSQELIIAGVVAIFLGIIVAFSYYRLKYSEDSRDDGDDWRIEALILGSLILICAQIPVIMVNRQVEFIYFSRYALAGSAGVAILLPALIYTIESRAVRIAILTVLVGIAVFTQHSNTIKARNETAALRDFWWQVSWRAPQIKQGTTFLANYALGDITEDYVVWGPASFIYYPYSASEKHISPAFSALLTNDQDAIVNNLIARREEIKYDNRRTIDVYQRYKRVLILSQPSLSSCVHSIDGSQSELSENEDLGLMFLAPYSRIDMIVPEGESPQPPTHILGAEPAHQWCYFYQKALLARQRGEWHKVRALGDEAFQKGFKPADPIEWLPFAQAYALEGNETRLRQIALMLEPSAFVKKQACDILMQMNLSRPETKIFIEDTYCTGSNP